MCRIGDGDPHFERRLILRSRDFQLHPQISSGEDYPVQFGGGHLDHAMPSAFSERDSVPSAHIR
jgi:hypothetical protein